MSGSATSTVLNSKRKIKHQLQISYSAILLFSITLTVGICLGLLFSLVRTTHNTASGKITSQTTQTLVAVALEVGNTVAEMLELSSENVVLNSVSLATILINYSNLSSIHGTLLTPLPYYKDYNFVPGCQAPNCPEDYPPLAFSSVFQSVVPNSYVNGSFSHPSIYLYSQKYNQAVRNDSFWDMITTESPEIMNVVNGLVYQDSDIAISYAPEVTLVIASLYYFTAQIENLQTGLTNIVHRTFPGIYVNEMKLGDPTQSDWFQEAPVNAIYLSGPFYLPLVNQYAVIMSSRKVVYFPEGTQDQRITFVSAGVMTLERLAVTCNAQYTDSGFAAVINTETNELLMWKTQFIPVYDHSTETFYTMAHFDPKIAAEVDKLSPAQKQEQCTIVYTDNDGIEWLVAYQPMFTSKRRSEGISYSPLAILVWSKLDESNAALVRLDDQLDNDSQIVWVTDLIVIAVTIGVVLLLVYFLVQYITSPLPKLIVLANEMIVMSTASEEDKDFSVILSDPLFSLDRHDEIGLLIADYYQLLTVLQERSLMNRDMSQYPANPFQIRNEELSTSTGMSTATGNSRVIVTQQTKTDFDWPWFICQMHQRLDESQRASLADCAKPKPPAKKVGFSKLRPIREGEVENQPVLTTSIRTKPKPIIKNSLLKGRKSSKVAVDSAPSAAGKIEFDSIPEETSISQNGVIYDIKERSESQKLKNLFHQTFNQGQDKQLDYQPASQQSSQEASQHPSQQESQQPSQQPSQQASEDGIYSPVDGAVEEGQEYGSPLLRSLAGSRVGSRANSMQLIPTTDLNQTEIDQAFDLNLEQQSTKIIPVVVDQVAVVAPAAVLTEPAPRIKSEHSKISKRSKQSKSADVTVLRSLRTQLFSLFAILIAGCILTMVLTALNIDTMGKEWTQLVKRQLRAKTTLNMQSIVGCKGAFAIIYFLQTNADMFTLAQFYRDVVTGTILRPNWYSTNNSELYIPSYALDPSDPYATGVVGSTNYSGYNVPYAAGCELTADNCSASQNSFNTRMTSILDLKLRSMYRPSNDISNIQIGLEDDATVRFIAYQHINFHSPTTCFHDSLVEPHCASQWAASSCDSTWVNPINASEIYFPPYDMRCRAWYQQSAADLVNTVQYTTSVSETQQYVLTASSAVFETPGTHTNLLGAVRMSYAVTELSDGLSTLNYLRDGYCYMVRADNTASVAFHPKAKAGCTTVMCAEGFSAEEYAAFSASVLMPFMFYQDVLQPGSIPNTFIKGGKEWQMVFVRIVYTNFHFIMIAVLPVEVITETAFTISSSINNTLTSMIIIFIFSIVFLLVLSIWYAMKIVASIVDPINELRKVFELVRMNEDLSGQVPEEASSSDMSVLLTAFSKLMIALRFSNESYAQGNQKRAHDVYTNALSLYTTNNDKRGIGMSLANLAGAELARKKYDAAESLYKKSIANAEDILFDTANPLSRAEEIKIERLLSERKECLAEVYLQCDRLEDAMTVLNPAMELDIQHGNLIGYALKQCAIARYYQLKNEFVNAEKIITDLLKFIRTLKRQQSTPASQHRATTSASSSAAASTMVTTNARLFTEERESAEQIALYRLCRVKKEMGTTDPAELESSLLHALIKNTVMHVDTVNKILIMLKKIYTAQEDKKVHVLQLNWLAQEFNLNVDRDTSNGGFGQNITNSLQPPKRIMFCLDYTAAMAGTSFQAVMDNINTVFELRVNANDSMSILYYNAEIKFGLPPTVKKDNELMILDSMEALTEPNGETAALYDAVMVSLYAMSREPTPDDWLIVVAGSDDTASRLSLGKTMDKVVQCKTGVIVIGVGDGVHSAAMQLLAGSTKRGVYFTAPADTKSINEAFDHALKIIEMSCGNE